MGQLLWAKLNMKVCGIEIKGSEAMLAVVEQTPEGIDYLNVETKRISLKDDEANEQVRSFYQLMRSFVRENAIARIAIKKRMKKGGFASGPVSFKIEGIIQLIDDAEIVFVPPATIAAQERKNNIPIPDGLNKYQAEAYRTAYTVIKKG